MHVVDIVFGRYRGATHDLLREVWPARDNSDGQWHYHPASNGLAERAVQVVKRGLKKITAGSISSRLAKVLLTYRIQPQGTTGISPAKLLLGRRPRTRLDPLRPNTTGRVEMKQWEQKERHDAKAKSRVFCVGDPVFARNFSAGKRWLAAHIVSQAGPVSFRVRLEDGRERRCHQDQLQHRSVEDDRTAELSKEEVGDDVAVPFPSLATVAVAPAPASSIAGEPPEAAKPSQLSQPSRSSVERSNVQQSAQPIRQYPRRNRHPREMFEPGKD